MAPTAAGNTASALPITACAVATTQKFGNKDIATAPTATVTAATTINARFHRVQSIKAPKGARAPTVAMPATIITTPISAGIPVSARQQVNREERPQPVLHVCQEEIEPIERPLRLHRGPPPLISGDQRGIVYPPIIVRQGCDRLTNRRQPQLRSIDAGLRSFAPSAEHRETFFPIPPRFAPFRC
jgi:hypothetical protein